MFNIANVAGFGLVGYGALIALGTLQTLALLFIPSMLFPGAKPWMVGKAAYCYILMFIGIFLMSIGGIPAVYGVLQKLIIPEATFSTQSYLALLLIFAVGGLTFLWHEHMVVSIDEASRRVCASVFHFTVKLIGYFVTTLSALAFVLTILFAGRMGVIFPVMPLILLVYGLLLSWATRFPASSPQSFQSALMMGSAQAAKTGAKKKK